MRKLFLPTAAAVAGLTLMTTLANAQAPLRSTGNPITMFVRGPNKSLITAQTPLDTPLWDARFNNPAVAPDGHQLTLGEWTQVEAAGAIKCVQQGSHVTVHASGLVPKGVYTIWVMIFDGPFPAGPNGNKPFPFGNLVGVGALGPNDGSENSFQASESGEGQVTAIMPTGLLSTSGPPFLPAPYDLTGCLLDEYAVMLVGVYHFNGQTYGPEPGYQFGAAEQFGILFTP